MEAGLLHVASSFTSAPIELSLRRSLADAHIDEKLQFAQHAQMSQHILGYGSAHTRGTLVLLRVEDWLREALKSSPSLGSSQEVVRHRLRTISDEFTAQIYTLSNRSKPIWFLACPSTGWIASRHKLITLCRTYTNLLVSRIQEFSAITTLRWPAFLFKGGVDDHGADRLGQIPFTQETFDTLGAFLGHHVARTWTPEDPSAALLSNSGRSELATYLKSLDVNVFISAATSSDRSPIDRLLRTAATFSLTGEQRDLSEEEIDALLASHFCLLIRVTDRFSDYGVAGVVAFRVNHDELIINSMSLSCTVLGKQVEHAMVAALAQIASERGSNQLVFEYRPSKRNQPTLAFLRSLADCTSGTRYVLPVASAKTKLNAAATDPEAFTVRIEASIAQSVH